MIVAICSHGPSVAKITIEQHLGKLSEGYRDKMGKHQFTTIIAPYTCTSLKEYASRLG